MATPRSGTKGKRVLPNIPHVSAGMKRGVIFNSETVETSIGGTQTHGKLKGDPLSPMNRLSSDEISLRSEDSSFLEDDSSCRSNKVSETSAPLRVNSVVDTSKANANVSVEILVKTDAANNESDKENLPGSPKESKCAINEQTPVHGSYRFFSNGFDEMPSLQIYSPSPSMKIRHGTPIRRHTLDEKLLGTPECYNVVQLDKNRYDFGFSDARIDDGEDSCSVTVAVRVRPYSQR